MAQAMEGEKLFRVHLLSSDYIHSKENKQ